MSNFFYLGIVIEYSEHFTVKTIYRYVDLFSWETKIFEGARCKLFQYFTSVFLIQKRCTLISRGHIPEPAFKQSIRFSIVIMLKTKYGRTLSGLLKILKITLTHQKNTWFSMEFSNFVKQNQFWVIKNTKCIWLCAHLININFHN